MSFDEFVVEDYKLALGYLQGQFQRLWQRFNFFLTVQIALFGFLGWLVFDKRSLAALPLVCILGFFVSVIWYLVAAQDRFLVRVYRERTTSAAEKIAGVASFQAKDYAKTYIGAETPSNWDSLIQWYCQPISITRLPVWLSILLALIWLALLLKGMQWFEPLLPPPPAK